MIDLAAEAGPDDSLYGLVLDERIRQVAEAHGLTYAEVSARVPDDIGWSSEQLRHRLVRTRNYFTSRYRTT